MSTTNSAELFVELNCRHLPFNHPRLTSSAREFSKGTNNELLGSSLVIGCCQRMSGKAFHLRSRTTLLMWSLHKITIFS